MQIEYRAARGERPLPPGRRSKSVRGNSGAAATRGRLGYTDRFAANLSRCATHQARLVDKGLFLVTNVSVDAPQIVVSSQGDLLCGQNPHQQAVVLVVVLERPRTPDRVQVGEGKKVFP